MINHTHDLLDGTLKIESDPKTGAMLGVIGRCSCGWDTGYRILPATATLAFDAHYERKIGKERVR